MKKIDKILAGITVVTAIAAAAAAIKKASRARKERETTIPVNTTKKDLEYALLTDIKTKKPIRFDRSEEECPNMLVFGMPGKGKTVFFREEIAAMMRRHPDDEFIVFDLHGEHGFKDCTQTINIWTDKKETKFGDLSVTNIMYDLFYLGDPDENNRAYKSARMADLCSIALSMTEYAGKEDIEKALRELISKMYLTLDNHGYTRDHFKASLKEGLPEEVLAAGYAVQQILCKIKANNRSPKHVQGLTVIDFSQCSRDLLPLATAEMLLYLYDLIREDIYGYRGIKRHLWVWFDGMEEFLKTDQNASVMGGLWKIARRYNTIMAGIVNYPESFTDKCRHLLLTSSIPHMAGIITTFRLSPWDQDDFFRICNEEEEALGDSRIEDLSFGEMLIVNHNMKNRYTRIAKLNIRPNNWITGS